MEAKRFAKIVLFSVMLLPTSVFSMNKGELVDAIAKDAGLSKADAKRALEAIIDSSVETYRETGSTVLLPFGRIDEVQNSPISFSVDGHVTVLKRNESPSSFDGHVTVLKSSDTGDLELTISR